jgi:hypothetical protein
MWILQREKKTLQAGIHLTCVACGFSFRLPHPRLPFHQSEALDEAAFRVQNHSENLFLVVGSLAKLRNTRSVRTAAPEKAKLLLLQFCKDILNVRNDQRT